MSTKTKGKFSTKRHIRAALDAIDTAAKELDAVRQHYDMEWGDNGHCDLDLAMSYALTRLQEATKELDDLLVKFRGRGIPLDWPKGRSWV